ncbi:hypothetical protein DI272_19015 [Streptomyces sp. Act143]|uniref:hypothetical protein n=1 Tax=Streptomyces sp. Act143 TaxID=2200760 RepID=UPI000D67EBBE|nr:hypothetical protein [Streptomyces sp. Act143]PWI16025.1 hypothetical protein DI272_19015 [Streptomyces sp. Act143]
MSAPDIGLRDLAEAYHAAALLGLTSPAAALVTDGVGLVFAVIALAHSHLRPAATLGATSAATWLITTYAH